MVNTMAEKPASTATSRLTREDWMREALQVLVEGGPAMLSIEKLAAELGVSRGSFYWHFKNREDFIAAVLQHWHDTYTASITDALDAEGLTGPEKFRRLFRGVHESDLARIDIPMRYWAMQDPAIAEFVSNTDEFRLNYMKSVLAECGLSGRELEYRARACIAFMAMDKRMFDPSSSLTSDKDYENAIDWFLSKK
jgi:AcrR family transcriptional regulator